MNTFAVFEGEKQVFTTGNIDPLVINIVLGLNDIGTNFLKDEFVFVELDLYSINARILQSGTVYIVLNTDKKKIDLDPFIEAYLQQ